MKDTMNPYEVLNVSKDASQQEIKDAYRDLAKKHHPDKAGCEETFVEIGIAFEILSDQKRRALFDEFGRVDERNLENEALQILCQAFKASVDSMIISGTKCKTDLVKSVKQVMTRTLSAMHDTKSIKIERIKNLKEINDRLSSDKEDSPLLAIVEDDIKRSKEDASKIDDMIERTELAIKMADDYSYRTDAPDPFGGGSFSHKLNNFGLGYGMYPFQDLNG